MLKLKVAGVSAVFCASLFASQQALAAAYIINYAETYSSVNSGVATFGLDPVYSNKSIDIVSFTYTGTSSASSNVNAYLQGAGLAAGEAAASTNFTTDGAKFEFTGTNSAYTIPNTATTSIATSTAYFRYYFTAISDLNYNITYDLSPTPLGCCGSSLSIYDVTSNSNVTFHTDYGTDGSGALIGTLNAGDKYNFVIGQNQYPGYEGALASDASTSDIVNFDDRYSLTLTPIGSVPEPATWMLGIFGMGLAGYALRRGQRFSRPFDTTI